LAGCVTFLNPVAEVLTGWTQEAVGRPLDSVIRDNKDSADSLAMLLRWKGNDIRTAHDGVEALEVADTFQPKTVLLDIGLPKLNGYDVARRIRKQPWGQDVLLIALTGWGNDEDKRLAQEAGFNFHIVKPVDLSALEELLAGEK
jgi:CheY-like chemotaxis protein